MKLTQILKINTPCLFVFNCFVFYKGAQYNNQNNCSENQQHKIPDATQIWCYMTPEWT